MNEILDFVIENYMWFILGGVVLLMTIIGYIADKTQFGSKKEPKKESKKKEKNSAPDPATVLEKRMEAVKEQPVHDTEVVEKEEPMENLDAIEIQEPEVHYEERESSESKEQIEESIPEDLYAGLDGTPHAYKHEEHEVEDLDMDLPNIESLNQDLEDEATEDDDIWKF